MKKKKGKQYTGGINGNSPIFKSFLALLKEKSQKEFEKLCLKLGPKQLKKIRRLAREQRDKKYMQDFVVANTDRVIKGINKLFLKMQKKGKKK